MRLRWSLFALVALALVPLVLVAGLAAWWAHRDERRDLEQGLLERARALALAVDREVEISIGALDGLATSDRLDTGDLRAFYEQARRAKAAYPRWLSVALIDPSGRQLLDLLRPLGTPLASVADIEVFQRTRRTRQPEVSALLMGPTAHRWLIVINVPVLRDGQLRYVLSATMTPDGFASLLTAAQIPADSLGTIIDRHGIVVARSQDHDQRVGTPAAPGYVALASQHAEGVFRGQTSNGWNAYRAFSRASRAQLTVGIAVPVERVDAALRRSLWTLAGTGIVALGLSVGFAMLAGRRLTRGMADLALALRAFGRGDPIPALPTFRVSEFSGVTQALRDAMALLQARSEALQKSETDLAASEGRYRRLIEESPDGILIQQEGIVRFINAAGARLFGYDQPADAIGAHVLTHTAPEYRETVAARIEARRRGEPVPAVIRLEALRRDGGRFWIEATTSVIDWEGAPATRISCIDISEGRRREAAEREAEGLRSVAKLANAAAHEINNPLTVIVGSLHFLRGELGDHPTAQAYFERAQRAVQRITAMIEHMKHITRLEPLASLDTAGVETLDLRQSSGPTPGPEPTEPGADPPRGN